jgi:hypothetical protein
MQFVSLGPFFRATVSVLKVVEVVAFKRVCRKLAALQETATIRHQIFQQKGETGQTVVLVKTCYFYLIQISMWSIFKEIYKDVQCNLKMRIHRPCKMLPNIRTYLRMENNLKALINVHKPCCTEHEQIRYFPHAADSSEGFALCAIHAYS